MCTETLQPFVVFYAPNKDLNYACGLVFYWKNNL